MPCIANALSRAEYIALVGSFLLVGLEAIIRILTLALRMVPCRFADFPANMRQLLLSFPSSIAHRGDCSIDSHPPKQRKQGRGRRVWHPPQQWIYTNSYQPSQVLFETLPTLLISARFTDTMQKNMSYKRGMDTYCVYTGWHGRKARKTRESIRDLRV